MRDGTIIRLQISWCSNRSIWQITWHQMRRHTGELERRMQWISTRNACIPLKRAGVCSIGPSLAVWTSTLRSADKFIWKQQIPWAYGLFHIKIVQQRTLNIKEQRPLSAQRVTELCTQPASTKTPMDTQKTTIKKRKESSIPNIKHWERTKHSTNCSTPLSYMLCTIETHI